MTDGNSNLNLRKNKDKTQNDDTKTWSILLPEILILVMSRLIMKDRIRASTICKAWYKASAYIQMQSRHLWLMKHSLRINTPCELYDPSQNKTYTMEFPEITGMKISYSKDGWLLMCKDRSSELSFFNPFTRQLISLPDCQSYNKCVVFTSAPTSSSCLVFGLTNINDNNNLVAISTFRLGETKWNTSHFSSYEHYFANNKIIFSGGLFYCLGVLGSVAVFDPSKRTWDIHHLKDNTFSARALLGTYLLENEGDIFLLQPLREKTKVYKLNRDASWMWEEKDRINDGLTIFAAVCASECRSNLTSNLKNKLFWSNWHHPAIHIYCFDQGRYLSNNSYIPSWNLKTIYQNVWIDHPKQCLEFS